MRSVLQPRQLQWVQVQRMNSAMHPYSEAEVMNKVRRSRSRRLDLSHDLGQSHGRSRFLDATGKQHRN